MSKVTSPQLLHFCNNCITTICDWLIIYRATFLTSACYRLLCVLICIFLIRRLLLLGTIDTSMKKVTNCKTVQARITKLTDFSAKLSGNILKSPWRECQHWRYHGNKVLFMSIFPLMCTLSEIWILPINLTIWRYNDVRLRHCVNQVTAKNWKWRVHFSL